MLREHGFGALSMIGNNAAKALLTTLQTRDSAITFFLIGHAAPEATRRGMVDWLRPRYPHSKILVLNPPNQETFGADYNVPQKSTRLWLPIIASNASIAISA